MDDFDPVAGKRGKNPAASIFIDNLLRDEFQRSGGFGVAHGDTVGKAGIKCIPFQADVRKAVKISFAHKFRLASCRQNEEAHTPVLIEEVMQGDILSFKRAVTNSDKHV